MSAATVPRRRNRHVDVHSILDLITERQAVVAAAIATLREQIGELTDELRTTEIELNDLATTRTTLTRSRCWVTRRPA